MVEPSARIRSYQPDDHKLARFFIGRANFEVLAVANRKEFGDKFVGFIAVDASLDATSEDTVISSATQGSKASRKEVVSTKAGTSSIATIRHFYVKEEYRPALSQDDLLYHAIQHAFTSDKAVAEIRVTDLELASWASQAFRKQGFIIDKQVAKVGVLGWSIRERVLTRERWKKIQDAN
ncbi:hypothetical protein PHLCEN_2v394 [Hermanssonia centrifuga]|uniref:N-acetyltransferase domain-containing protein n=1 Tax=Hermanssonia centrifuga TaxID=98765 RepID=A0A2R6S5Y0_9APHY|nr:hypothetical protein PHLCEN_2v394 [Hermanssonia centrifuga]